MPEPVQVIGTVVKWEAENVICMRETKMGNDGTAFQETETGREEADNLMYEIESAKRQLSSLQGILAAKNKEVASLHAQLIERDVLLKQAAVCISEAISLCRQQADHTKEAHNFLKDYEEEWETLERRMRKVQEEMPFVPVPDILPGREEGCVDKIRVRGGKLREGSGGASEAVICRIMGCLQGCGVPTAAIYNVLPVIYSNFQ